MDCLQFSPSNRQKTVNSSNQLYKSSKYVLNKVIQIVCWQPHGIFAWSYPFSSPGILKQCDEVPAACTDTTCTSQPTAVLTSQKQRSCWLRIQYHSLALNSEGTSTGRLLLAFLVLGSSSVEDWCQLASVRTNDFVECLPWRKSAVLLRILVWMYAYWLSE